MPEKRDSPPAAEETVAKRQRVDCDDSVMEDVLSPATMDDATGSCSCEVKYPSTQHFNARCGIQRSIALAAAHIGFESTSPQVMESFTGLIEACTSLVLYLTEIMEQC